MNNRMTSSPRSSATQTISIAPVPLRYQAPSVFSLKEWLDLIPADTLETKLAERAEDGLAGIDADPKTLAAAWDVVGCLVARLRRLPTVDEAAHLTAVDRARLSMIIERMEVQVRHVAGFQIRLEPVADRVFDDDDQERTRRAAIYASQWEVIERRYEAEDNPARRGPAAASVECVESGQVFPSARLAAQWLGVSRADIRTAIKRNTRCGGFWWRYASAPRVLRDTGREMAVRCVEVNGVSCDLAFRSAVAAARWASGSSSSSSVIDSVSRSRVIRMGGRLFRFEQVAAAPNGAAANEVTAANLSQAAVTYRQLLSDGNFEQANELAPRWPFLLRIARGQLRADVVSHFYARAPQVLARVIRLRAADQDSLVSQSVTIAEWSGASIVFRRVDARLLTIAQMNLLFETVGSGLVIRLPDAQAAELTTRRLKKPKRKSQTPRSRLTAPCRHVVAAA